jgi:hypothetical protein
MQIATTMSLGPGLTIAQSVKPLSRLEAGICRSLGIRHFRLDCPAFFLGRDLDTDNPADG